MTQFCFQIRKEQMEVNKRIVALRDSKIRLVSQLHLQARQIREIQQRLPAHLRRPLPPLPTMAPAEMPETKLQPSRAVLERYRILAAQRWAIETSTIKIMSLWGVRHRAGGRSGLLRDD